ncbi:MAG: type II toxin-antitoxin system HipA family toxin [bacterium]|nr:type II toxin-antitoxin system HipA family toxin [bacterium]
MGRRNQQRELIVAMNGLAVGRWTTSSAGSTRFRYLDDWLQLPASLPVSLSMPLSTEPFQGEVVWNFFDNLLPDNADIRRRLQARLGVASTRPFDLLAGMGGDCVGALQIYPPAEQPQSVRTVDAEELDDVAIAETLKNYRDRPLGIDRHGEFRISIAGAQEKTALLRRGDSWLRPRGATPTSHILKLPIGPGINGIDLTDSVENEWLCLQLVAAFGLPVARAEVATFVDQKVLVVERFDRRWAKDGSWLMRLHQEDFCQALGVSPGIKCESDGGPGVAAAFDLLRRSREPEPDRRTFFRALVVYWLLAAIDGHAKNFSLMLLPGGRCRMAPLYDVLSVHPLLAAGQLQKERVRMAMAALGKNRHYRWDGILSRHWRSTAAAVGLPQVDAEQVLADLVDRGPGVLDTVADQLPAGFPAALAEPVFTGVRQALDQLGAAATGEVS